MTPRKPSVQSEKGIAVLNHRQVTDRKLLNVSSCINEAVILDNWISPVDTISVVVFNNENCALEFGHIASIANLTAFNNTNCTFNFDWIVSVADLAFTRNSGTIIPRFPRLQTASAVYLQGYINERRWDDDNDSDPHHTSEPGSLGCPNFPFCGKSSSSDDDNRSDSGPPHHGPKGHGESEETPGIAVVIYGSSGASTPSQSSTRLSESSSSVNTTQTQDRTTNRVSSTTSVSTPIETPPLLTDNITTTQSPSELTLASTTSLSTSNSPTAASGSTTGLSRGAQAGIGLAASLVGLGIIGTLIWVFIQIRRRLESLEAAQKKAPLWPVESSSGGSIAHVCGTHELDPATMKDGVREKPDDHVPRSRIFKTELPDNPLVELPVRKD